jgi:hypothetical protein
MPNVATASASASEASNGSAKERVNANAARDVVTPVGAHRGATAPPIGMNRTAPPAKARRIKLSRPSDRPKASFSGGIAADQAPMPRPLTKNTASVAALARPSSVMRSTVPIRGPEPAS